MGKLTWAGVVTEAVNTKVTTRQTYVLTGIGGDLISKDGKLTFIEKDGIDYAPTTVQLPGRRRIVNAVLLDEGQLAILRDEVALNAGQHVRLAGGHLRVNSLRDNARLRELVLPH